MNTKLEKKLELNDEIKNYQNLDKGAKKKKKQIKRRRTKFKNIIYDELELRTKLKNNNLYKG
jgi:hypothetical protein